MKTDYRLPRDLPIGIGNRLYLLGTSEDGPYMEPTFVRHKAHARSLFGDENKGTLVKAFDEAYDRNEDISIYLMRITGKSATLDIEGIVSEDPKHPQYCLRLYTIHAGQKYNQYSAYIEEDVDRQMRVFYLNTSTEQIVYELPLYITIGAFVKGINEDCRMGRHNVMATTDYPQMDFGPIITWLSLDNELTLINVIDYSDGIVHQTPEDDGSLYVPSEDDGTEEQVVYEDELERIKPFNFYGGEDGLDATRDDLYIACNLAYKLLEGKSVDIIVPVGMYVDDVHPAFLYGKGIYGTSYYSSTSDYLQLIDTMNNNQVVSYHEQLIEFCREQMRLGFMTHGVIGMRPYTVVPESIERDNSYIARLAASTAFRDRHGFLEYKNGSWYDKGYFVSVVPMELIFRKDGTDRYFANGAVRYAAILTGHFNATTNVELGNDVELRYELPDGVVSQLSDLGLVAFRYSVRKGNVVASGVTASSPDTELHNVANVRMVQIVISYMNDAINDVYESEYDEGMRRNFLEQQVKDRLDLLTEHGIILTYDYAIQYRNDGVKGEILLTLESKHTIEAIQVSSEVSYREG
jgi:hypothetical protein